MATRSPTSSPRAISDGTLAVFFNSTQSPRHFQHAAHTVVPGRLPGGDRRSQRRRPARSRVRGLQRVVVYPKLARCVRKSDQPVPRRSKLGGGRRPQWRRCAGCGAHRQRRGQGAAAYRSGISDDLRRASDRIYTDEQRGCRRREFDRHRRRERRRLQRPCDHRSGPDRRHSADGLGVAAGLHPPRNVPRRR